ncbi:MAG: phosphatase PAP2 family protein [Vulcanimicrobiaceae bacterium]
MILVPGLLIAAVAAAIGFFVLGFWIMRGRPVWFDGLAAGIFGRATGTAALLTRTGYAPFLVLVTGLALVLALLHRVPLAAVAAIAISQGASQTAVTLAKRLFRRLRPDEWLVNQELGHSYPSGHATTAFAFYGGWLGLIVASEWPVDAKLASVVVLAAWILGICWSRVALGAHYPTDVTGGALIGFAFLCLSLAALRHYRLA